MGAQVDQLAAELGAAQSTVIADMDQLGTASLAGERLALGREFLAQRRRERRARAETRTHELGSPTCART